MNVSDTLVTRVTRPPINSLRPALRRATLGLLAATSLGLAAPAGAHGGWERYRDHDRGWHGHAVRAQPWGYYGGAYAPVRRAPVVYAAPVLYPQVAYPAGGYAYGAPAAVVVQRPVIVRQVVEPVAPGVILGSALGAYLGYQLSR